MIVAVADTHAVAWSAFEPRKLSARVRRTFLQAEENGNQIGVPTIAIVEAVILVELGRFPTELLRYLGRRLTEKDFLVEVPLTRAVAFRMQDVSRIEVPEMADRIIAATALELGLPLISRDGKIRASRVRTVW